MTVEQLDIAPREIVENEPQTSAASRFIPVYDVPSDPTLEQYMRIIEVSGALDFWDREEEDIYSPEDGDPV